MNKEKIKIAFVGAGGHANSVFDCLDLNKFEMVGVYDDKIKTENLQWPLLGTISDANKDFESKVFDKIFVAIGNNTIRSLILEKKLILPSNAFINVISPDAYVSPKANILGHNIFIGRFSYIGPNSIISNNALVNTGAIIEHDVLLGSNSSLAPRAVINGFTEVGDNCEVATGAVIINGLSVTNNVVIGAGAIVVKNIVEAGLYLGVPAKHRER